MIARHSLQVVARCPVDGAVDIYQVTVETDRTIFVETILAEVARVTAEPMTQEILTDTLSAALRAKVTSVGFHSGVRTEVVAE